MSTTPNMSLLLPDATVTAGPEWAVELNNALTVVDGHDHTSGKGTKVPVSGLNINQDLSLDSYQLTNAKSVKLNNLTATLSGAGNEGKVHEVGGNLYFTNSGGTPVQITVGNGIVPNVIVPANPLMPSGSLLDFAGTSVPSGFLACDGAAVSRTTYSDLFASISTVYGVGNGTTTFNVPNFSGRAAIGSGTYTDTVSGSITRTVGQSLGAEKHTLTVAQMPSHNHIQDPHTHNIITPVGGSGAGSGQTVAFPSGVTSATTAVNNPTGGDLPHNNMQPSLVILKIIKY